MGHGYYTVIGWCFLVPKQVLLKAVTTDMINQYRASRTFRLANVMSRRKARFAGHYVREAARFEARIAKLSDSTRMEILTWFARTLGFDLHYEQQYEEPDDDVFVALQAHSECVDARGAGGAFSDLSDVMVEPPNGAEIGEKFEKLLNDTDATNVYTMQFGCFSYEGF